MEPRHVELPVAEVTVLEDRALVTRRASVALGSGNHALVVVGVSPTMIDKTLSVRLSAGRVVQARIVRVPSSTRASQEEKVALWMERARAHAEAVAEAELALTLAQEAIAAIRAIETLALVELAEDLSLGRDVAPRMEALASLRARLGDALDAEVAGGQALSRAAQVERDTREMLRSLNDEERTISARLELQVHIEDAATVEVSARYAVAGAMWRPAHVATLRDDGTLHLESQACVWQATGEDWPQARLSFSTERPSLGTEPPQLHTDTLSLQPKAQQVQVQARDQVIATTGEGAAQRGGETRDELPGVDDGGEPLALQGEGLRSIASNGRPHRVPLFSFESGAEAELICRPEKVEAVLLRTTASHRGRHPLLAGPVELRRQGGFVGRTSTLFVAPGETFELGWGPEPDLRVHRKVELGEESRRALSSWVRKPRTIRVTISNLGPKPHTIRLQERVMVSEIDKVEVEHGPLGGGSIDDDGILTRSIDVRGFGEATYAFEWTVVVHDDVRGL